MVKWVRIRRSYAFVDKSPVIGVVQTILQDAGVFDRLDVVAEISTLRKPTLNGWFYGDTRSPQHESIMAVITSHGYKEEFVKVKDIDVEHERKISRAWLAKQPKPPKRKTNGAHKPRKKKS
jgi:hypothetical protein